ncbi:PD-(D/E)XK nuclease family protein [Bifidobacterium castoris]|uniref:ATP-dependent DNA helicase, UvrD/REP family n=1 Tax=Bifidobacterium castoris TaxID=2306972 RepID=A0A430F5Y4_9BIFI|nr:PD-(D/E)XK nuclease family protein [Bifidobacterium castoris]RSX47185.1 ATP-dependent DNA helicase, UvrD/REP family [Bifidobacterium castoris]
MAETVVKRGLVFTMRMFPAAIRSGAAPVARAPRGRYAGVFGPDADVGVRMKATIEGNGGAVRESAASESEETMMRERDHDGRTRAAEDLDRRMGGAEAAVRRTVHEALMSEPVRAALDARDARAPQNGQTPAVLVVGPPRSGKTSFAIDAAKEAMTAFGAQGAVLAVTNRRLADDYTPELIRHVGVSTSTRPATTLNALAFRLVAARRAHDGEPAPRLLNGAEQDALLRRVLAVHLDHVRSGDMCGTCRLLRDYFRNERWAAFVADGDAAMGDDDPSGAVTTEALLEEGVSAAFVAQLRDMLARMDEVGAGAGSEEAMLAAVGRCGMRGERLRIQWRLAYALRAEYIATMRAAHPDEYRLDASYLQVAGTEAVRTLDESDLPRIVIVDDVQDLTLAGFGFLEALHARGVRLVLAGNPDESVQSFRGSYPEYLFRQIDEHLRPARLVLADAGDDDYLRTVQARVSLSVATSEDGLAPMPQRPGKMPALPGAYPIAPVTPDDSVLAALYRTPVEEGDDVVWHIKTEHLLNGTPWNDMAVIMHDNGAIRAYGERLRRDGVPVRFSSVTRPLADEPFVEGLFSLIELAQLRCDGVAGRATPLKALAAFVRSRVRAIVASPLLDVAPKRRDGADDDATHPMDMHMIDAAMRALQSIADVQDRAELIRKVHDDEAADPARAALDTLAETCAEVDAAAPAQALDMIADDARDAADGDGEGGADVDGAAGGAAAGSSLGELRGMWTALHDAAAAAHAAGNVHVLGDEDGDDVGFGVDALYLLLADDGAPKVVETVASICGAGAGDRRHVGRNAPARRFARLWEYVGRIARQLRTLAAQDAARPRFALEAAWGVCDVAAHWQRLSLFNTPVGRAANDRLDVAMRLFDYVDRNGGTMSITTFINQVRQLQIEADSLARTAPLDQAVTLTTPAGAVGRHWRHVWLPGVQEGVWPNLAARNTMFGGEDLVDIRLYGELDMTRGERTGQRDIALQEVLGTEQKSFLVALTRADVQAHVSATLNDDAVPSEFLYGYMPEHFDRARDAKPETRVYTQPGDGDGLALDADARGLIALARARLAASADGGVDDAEVDDAIDALALLAVNGYADAGPGNWPFLGLWGEYRPERKPGEDAASAADAAASANTNTAVERGVEHSRGDGSSLLRATIPSISNVPFIPWRHGEAAASHGADAPDAAGGAPTVTLSPSAVDALWGCPVCARMEREFFGPTVQPFTLDYGSIVHAVLEHATRMGWDMPDYQDRLDLGDAQLEARFRESDSPDYATWDEVARRRAERLAGQMIAYYETLRIDPETIRDADERYDATLRDERTRRTLLNAADYLVRSNLPIYEQGPESTEEVTVTSIGRNGKEKTKTERHPRRYTHSSLPTVGRLVEAEAEISFDASFTLADVTAAFNDATKLQLDADQLAAVMGALIGGWPCEWDHRMRIRLAGRIDRRETRRDEGGALSWRLIDYKTGRMHGRAESFSDLQLVCYQLAMRFPHVEDGGAGARGARLPVARAALFDVAEVTYPSAKKSKAEMHYQEPLFAGDALNAGDVGRRDDPNSTYAIAKLGGLFPQIRTFGDIKPPDGVDEEVWGMLAASARGESKLLVWSLTMIARVFYAAAASLASTIDAHPTPEHVRYCHDKPICPACAEKMQTVYETKGM